jgi:hypothetical protein
MHQLALVHIVIHDQTRKKRNVGYRTRPRTRRLSMGAQPVPLKGPGTRTLRFRAARRVGTAPMIPQTKRDIDLLRASRSVPTRGEDEEVHAVIRFRASNDLFVRANDSGTPRAVYSISHRHAWIQISDNLFLNGKML